MALSIIDPETREVRIAPDLPSGMYLSLPVPDEAEARIGELESALLRIANTKHGDRNWMQGVARKVLAR